jgi:hypothetical protein
MILAFYNDLDIPINLGIFMVYGSPVLDKSKNRAVYLRQK